MGALVLNREEGQVVWVGQTKIKIVSARGRRARLAFEGPLDTQILRDELATYTEDGTVIKKPKEESPIGHSVRNRRQPSELVGRMRQRLAGRDDKPRVEGEAGRVVQGSRPEAGGMPHGEDGDTV